MDGKVDVSVPIVDTRDDYIVVREYRISHTSMPLSNRHVLDETVFGDSGNASPKFTIQNPYATASSAVPTSTVSATSALPTTSAV